MTNYIEKTTSSRGIATRVIIRGSAGTDRNFLLVDYFTTSCPKGTDPKAALDAQAKVPGTRAKSLRLVWNGETWVSMTSKPMPKSVKRALDDLTPAEKVSMLEGLTAHETIEIMADLAKV